MGRPVVKYWAAGVAGEDPPGQDPQWWKWKLDCLVSPPEEDSHYWKRWAKYHRLHQQIDLRSWRIGYLQLM